MNIIARQNYESQDERFKTLIKIDNPYLSLFMNLVKLDSATVKKTNLHLYKLHHFMTVKVSEDPCPHCYLTTKNMWTTGAFDGYRLVPLDLRNI